MGDHDTLIPPYFNDQRLLIHLAFLLSPQIGGSSLEKIVLDYITSDEDEVDTEMGDADAEFGEAEAEAKNEDIEVEILDEAPAVFQTPRKRKSLKLKEKLDDSFLRRSRRIANKPGGYKDVASAKAANQVKEPFTAEEDVVDPCPLAIIPGPSNYGAAPHLPKEILEGIATGFLQIQPKAASAALLEKDNIDE